MKILLTGGTGFIGRNILESYLSEKYNIHAPKRGELDLVDTLSADEYFKTREFDAVIHAAGKPGHRNAKDLDALCYSNLRIFYNLERHRDKFGKFLNLGSGAIYDISAHITNAKEENIFKRMGADAHGFCKYIVAKRIETLPSFVDLNIFGLYGKYEDYEIRFISNALVKALVGLPITLRQNRRFSYLYIDDLMPILEFFLENDCAYNSYNITPDSHIELLGLGELAAKIAGGGAGIRVSEEGYGLDYYGNNARLKGEFAGLTFTPIEDGVERLCAYYRGNLDKIERGLLLRDK